MRRELIPLLACPSCWAGDLRLVEVCEEGEEIREGHLACAACGREYGVSSGIVDLLFEPSPEVERERLAWESLRSAQACCCEDRERSREWLLALPMLEGKEGPRAEMETWRRHGRAAFALCAGEDWRGRRVLELGAGRCWLSAYLARMGAEVVATDILGDDDIGLGCAEAFLGEGVLFDRVLCDMHRLPFKPGSFHAVVATATLHHSPDIAGLAGEIGRVLAPGGSLLGANEPLYVPWRETPEEERRGAHEGAYPLHFWLRVLRRAGFKVTELEVGRDASLSFRGVLAPPGGSPRLRRLALPVARYLSVLVLALPRLTVRKARRLRAGWPVRPATRRRLGDLAARLGFAPVGGEALAGEDGNWGPGWYPAEGGDEPFRWAGPRSRFLLSAPPGPALLVLELATFRPSPQTNPVVIEVRVRGRKAGSIRIDRPGWHLFRLPGPSVRGGRPVSVTLRVREGYFVPREMGLGGDDRLLGVACRRAHWHAQTGSAPDMGHSVSPFGPDPMSHVRG